MPVTVTSVSEDGFRACTKRMRDGCQSLGLGHRDIVFLQGRDHVGAQHAHEPGHSPSARVSAGSTKQRKLPTGSSANGT